MNREIPGFYYDGLKRKYFRIENSRTASAQAAWSSENVKRRAVEEKEVEKTRQRLLRESRRVKRSRVRDVPLMGGLLAREAGEDCAKTLTKAWAGGLREKGSLELWPGLRKDRCVISALWVGGGDEQSGLGVAYVVLNGAYLTASCLPRDADDRISFRSAAERYPIVPFQPATYDHSLRAIKSIEYHEPSSKVLVGYELDNGEICIKHFTPGGSRDWDTIRLLVGDNGDPGIVNFTLSINAASTIHALRPAPSSSRLTCIAGTGRGIAQVQNDRLTWLTSAPTPPKHRRHPHSRTDAAAANPTPWKTDILSVDFLHQNPADLILAGTRSSHVCVLDTRVPPREWSIQNSTFTHTSSVAHVRSVGAYEVLAAGPRNAMALYDVRFLQQRRGHGGPADGMGGGGYRWKGDATRPVVVFPSYRNEAHIQIGLDVLADPGFGSGGGVVAAAHDDGTVGLYSLRDGSRLPTAADSVDGIKGGGVVQGIRWQTLPGDRHPSLFVGEGTAMKKYSFWA